MVHDMPLIQEYIGQAAATKLKLVESKSSQVGDIPSQKIRLSIDEEDVEISAFGILYSVSLLSFPQARPAGVSVIDYREQDIWSVEDFFRHLSFEHGRLHFYADYVRGRLMKTTVEISNPNNSSSGGLGAEKHLGTRINTGRAFAAPEVPALCAGHPCRKQAVNASPVPRKSAVVDTLGRSQPVCGRDDGKSSAHRLEYLILSAFIGVHPCPAVLLLHSS